VGPPPPSPSSIAAAAAAAVAAAAAAPTAAAAAAAAAVVVADVGGKNQLKWAKRTAESVIVWTADLWWWARIPTNPIRLAR
jgi:basic membrane lipoprotein Med (substrate-binding protein (PBP1-ABC) superfamily)